VNAEPMPTPNQILDAACILAAKGFKLIRVSPRSKVPYDKDWTNKATNDLATLTEWFDGGDFNLGLACGMQPNGLNIVAIDIDPKHGGLETWAEFVTQHGKVGGPRHDTPSGGFHLPLIFPEGFRNSRNMLGPGVDTRGEGGQILLPPSALVNQYTGEIVRYGASPGRSMWDMAPIHAPAALVEALSVKPVQVQRSVDRHPSQQESPLDFLRRTMNPVDVMTNRYGWQIHSVRGDDTYLTRPGKNPREGHSAIVHANGAIVVFTTTDVAHLVQRQTSDGTGLKMSLAELVAAEETDGDLAELSRRIREVMPRPTPALDVLAGEQASNMTDGSEDWADTSWFTPVDLTGILDGTEQLAPPSILLRADGMGMFYPGTINGIHGESGLGKGWVAVTTAAEVIRSGQAVVYVDLEDTPTSITTRLQNVGVTKDQVRDYLTYIRPDNRTSPVAIGRLVQLCRERHVALVVIDSLGEAFGLDSINEDKDNEVGPWLRQVPRTLADTGACVLIVDHVTKSVDNPLYPKGSARKRAAVGGAAYLVEALSPLTKGKGGKLRLTCAKDRYGFHARGKVSAEIVFTPSGEHDMLVKLWSLNQEDDGRSDQDHLDEKVAACAVEMLRVAKRRRSAFTKTNMVDSTAGARAEIKRAAFDLLAERGHLVEVEKGKFKVVA
jgi:hypothetical protein